MQPVRFTEMNKMLTKPSNMTDEECATLPVYNDGERSISCWKMNWVERLSALFFGKVWLYVVMGETQPPVSLLATRTIFVKSPMETIKPIFKKIGRGLLIVLGSIAYMGAALLIMQGWRIYYSNGALQLLFIPNACIPSIIGLVALAYIVTVLARNDSK